MYYSQISNTILYTRKKTENMYLKLIAYIIRYEIKNVPKPVRYLYTLFFFHDLIKVNIISEYSGEHYQIPIFLHSTVVGL